MASFPVKIPPELYQRLKQRAQEEGMTLQQALVDLLLDSHAGVGQLKRQLESLRAQVAQLQETRNKDMQALESWEGHWKAIPNLIKELNDLQQQLERAAQEGKELRKQLDELISEKQLRRFFKR